ncbi:MAG: glutamate-5-semialdehyde dehydrogenase [Melioribacteraceae bacterium]|nr:glutamate-5-semialdehyde dehydrogenase [Melioribacteraceae bacterium]
MTNEEKINLNLLIKDASNSSIEASQLSTDRKNNLLLKMADMLELQNDEILSANRKDLDGGKVNGLSESMLDRLKLTEERIEGMAQAIREIAQLPDPVGEITETKKRPNGIEVSRMRIPLGVIMMIYEARPNVTSDAAALCLKAGNTAILRGGKEAFHSNRAIASVLQMALVEEGINKNIITLIPTTERDAMNELLLMDNYIDLVIPRGGEGLIRFVNETSRIPVIMHYKGVCHIYIDKDADLEMAKQLTCEGKLSRPGVCNALETMIIHKDIAEAFLNDTGKLLLSEDVEIRGCEKVKEILPQTALATDEDYYEEFLSKIIAAKVVNSFDEATAHIQKYNSDHTEIIVTNNIKTARRFQREINSSVVGVNASARFSDGGELGLGAEIGISTSKLHAYGPMGIESLTTQKFIITGDGELRHSKRY